MNTRRNATWIIEEEIANAGVTPRGDKVPPLKRDDNDDKDPVNPPPLTDGDIRASLFQMYQDIITQEQAFTTQGQAMTDHANREIIPWANQQVATLDSCLRDFTTMNLPTFNGSKVEEDIHEFIDEIYKILYVKGLNTSEKAELATYQLKGVAKIWYVQWRDNR